MQKADSQLESILLKDQELKREAESIRPLLKLPDKVAKGELGEENRFLHC
jgi:hypothetical protein